MNFGFFQPNLLPRKLLLQKVNQARKVPILFISAPMGYGKTTIVKEFIDNVNEDIVCIWFSVYEQDDERIIWNRLRKVLAIENKHLVDAVDQCGCPRNNADIYKIIDITKKYLKKECIIVIDDYHNIITKNNIYEKMLNCICMEQIEKFHSIIISRNKPSDVFIELESKKLCLMLSEQDFKVDLQETKEFFKFNGFLLNDTEIKDLYSNMNGWISGIYLALLQYAENNSFKNVYKAEELMQAVIYNKLDKRQKDILLKLCLLDSFTAEQAYYITKMKDAVFIINELQKNNCFIEYDVNTRMFSIHDILRNVLLDMLQYSDIDKNYIYESCARWYLKNNDYVQAVQYYYKAENFDAILNTISENDITEYSEQCPQLIIDIFNNMPEEKRKSDERAYIVYIVCCVFIKDITSVKKIIDTVVEELKSSQISSNQIRGEIAVVESVLYLGDEKKMGECYKKAYKYFNGIQSRLLNEKFSVSFCIPHFSFLYYSHKGQYKKTINNIEKDINYYDKISNGIGTSIVKIIYAEYYLETGNIVDSKVYALKSLYRAEQKNQANISICSLFTLLRISMQVNNRSEFLLYEKKLDSINKEKLVPGMHNQIEIAQAYVFAIQGHIDKIPSWILANINGETSIYDMCKDYMLYIIQGINMLYCKEYIKLEIHIEIMNEIYSKQEIYLGKIYAAIFEAILYDIQNKCGDNIYLSKALDMAREDGVIMPFVELSPFLFNMIKNIESKDEYVLKIIEKSKVFINNLKKLNDDYKKVSNITKRELEVMKCVAQGYKQKHIAEELNISLATVKKHMGTVYDKLGAKNKVEALKILTENHIL